MSAKAVDMDVTREELLSELSKLREQSHRASQQARMLRLTEELANIGYWTLDVTAGTVHWSEEVYAIHGLLKDEFTPNLASAIEFYHSEDQERVRSFVDAAVVNKEDFEFEARLIRNDGEVRIVESQGRPEFSPDGTLHSIVGLFRDITEKKTAEHELRRSHERLRAHVENTPLGMVEWDTEFRIVEWNARCEEIFGYTKEEAVGRHGAELLVPEGIPTGEVDEIFRQLLSQAGGIHNTNVNVTKAGGRIECDWYNTALVDRNGAVMGVASIVQDSSERIQLESQFAQSQKMEAIGTLAGGIAHDMNNVLAVVLGLGTIVEMELEEGDIRSDVQDILVAARRGKEMVANLLGFARKGSFERTIFHLAPRLKGLVNLLRKTIPKEVHTLAVCADDLWQVQGDASQLMSGFMNLCLNAAQAIDGHGTINIAASNMMLGEQVPDALAGLQPGPYVCVSVSDDGCGMDSLTLERAMEPFFTTKAVGAGTGLGLSMVYGAVESHGGAVEILSTRGTGTVVSVFLPGHPAAEEHTTE